MSIRKTFTELANKAFTKASEIVSQLKIREKFTEIAGSVSAKMSPKQKFTALGAGLILIGALGAATFSDNGQARAENALSESVQAVQLENPSDTNGAVQTTPQITPGTTLPIADMGAALKQEGQGKAAIYAAGNFDPRRPQGNQWESLTTLMTTSANLDSWYLLYGDETLGNQSTEMTVQFAGTNMKVYNPEFKETPTLTEHKFSKRQAMRDILNLNQFFKKLSQEDREQLEEALGDEAPTDAQKAAFYDDMVDIFANAGYYVAFEGELVDHRGKFDGLATFFVKPGKDGVFSMRTTENGASFFTGIGVALSVFPEMQQHIANAPKAASLNQLTANTLDRLNNTLKNAN